MQLLIANSDYTSALDSTIAPRITRKLNAPEAMAFVLTSADSAFVVPQARQRVTLTRSDGHKLFTGYLDAAPEYEYLGWGAGGPAYRYKLTATSDECLLDAKRLPRSVQRVQSNARDLLRDLGEAVLPGALDYSLAQPIGPLLHFAANGERKWSEHAAGVAAQTRSVYRACDGKLSLAPLGLTTHTIDESAATFSPQLLEFMRQDRPINDVLALGGAEPGAYVKDYFLGDGVTVLFRLSQVAYAGTETLVNEEFKSGALTPSAWTLTDPSASLSFSAGQLVGNGGTGADGGATLSLNEQVELGGGLLLQMGAFMVTGACDAVLNGIFSGAVSIADCIAGFRLTPSSSNTQIQPLINGALAGSALVTTAGHQYALTLRIMAHEICRVDQTFHSSSSARGGDTRSCTARVVLEVHDVDPANAATMQAISTTLFDGIVDLPATATYALLDAATLHGSMGYTRIVRGTDHEVRSTIPNQPTRTRLIGAAADGAECVVTKKTLIFHDQYAPVQSEAVTASYRASRIPLAREQSAGSIAALVSGADNGLRSAILHIQSPAPRTSQDCENAALALLDDLTQPRWAGKFECWSDFLPSGQASDPLPGDAVQVIAPSRNADFSATLREVELELRDPLLERCWYTLRFANDAAAPLAITTGKPAAKASAEVGAYIAGLQWLDPLINAAITAATSTTVSVDAGAPPPAGGGIEVRSSDSGWSLDSDRGLIGRFAAQVFTLPRLTRLITFHLRQYDANGNYSRHTCSLHLDYPL